MRQVGVWDRNAIKLGCDDHCTNINIIKFIKAKKIMHISLICGISKKKVKPIETKSRMVVSRGWSLKKLGKG